ncbi:MAG: hypothetical protein IPK04_20435 [Bdellovibrionales bacterium]|nr:hypothetical protein [Bdellovibrionales bacterium]
MVWRSCLKYIQVSFLFVTLPALAAVPADYSITLTLEVLKPISEVSSINTDAQTVKIVNENEKTVTLEIQVRPLTDQLTHLQPNPNWRAEYSQTPSLQEYLRPRLRPIGTNP